jgi:hypothetical protein
MGNLYAMTSIQQAVREFTRATRDNGWSGLGADFRVRSFEVRSLKRAESVNRPQKQSESMIALEAIMLSSKRTLRRVQPSLNILFVRKILSASIKEDHMSIRVAKQ